MGGFGSGPFGNDPFGEWGWAKSTLYRTIPAIYRRADEENNFLLRKYVDGQLGSFDNIRHHIEAFGDLRDPFKARTEYADSTFVTLGKVVIPAGEVFQNGIAGRVNALGVFTATDRATRFQNSDVGKKLFIRRSANPDNSGETFRITSVLNQKEVYTDPLIRLDAGPMRWELQEPVITAEDEIEVELRGGDPRRLEVGWIIDDGSQQNEVLSRQIYWQSVLSNQYLNEVEGSEGYVDSDGMFVGTSYNFTAKDVGKVLSVTSTENYKGGFFEIVGVSSGRAVIGALEVPGTNNNPNGKTTYRYLTTADRPVSIQHLYEQDVSLPLQLSWRSDSSTQGRLAITVRLATDASTNITTLPADIQAAISADPFLSQYIEVFPSITSPSPTVVGEFDRSLIKGRRLPETSGPLFWGLRPFARITLRANDAPLGVVTEDGYDLQIPAGTPSDPLHTGADTTRVLAPSAPFRTGDAGKLLTIKGSSVGNDGTYEITQVLSTTRAVVRAYLEVDTTARFWEMRTAPTLEPDPTRLNALPNEVQSHAQALLNIFAYDFGIEVDTQQTEVRQRAWVRQSSEVAALKGTTDAIRGVAYLSGFEAEVVPLYTISAYPNMGTEAEMGFTIIYVEDEGSSRTAGTISSSSGVPVFSDATQNFKPSDVGRVLELNNSAAVPTNDNYWVIREVLSSTEVSLYSPSIGGSLGAVTPINYAEPNNGSLVSSVGNIYAPVGASYFLMDDIDMDYVAVMADVTGRSALDRPGIDKLCAVWPLTIGSTSVNPDAMSASTGMEITAVSTVGTIHTLTVRGDDTSIVLGGGWQITDSTGTDYFLENPPALIALGAPVPVTYTDLDGVTHTIDTYPNAEYEMEVFATFAPALGDIAMQYVCNRVFDCDNCPSYRVLINLTATQVLSEGQLANDRAFDRIIDRINEVLPVNAEAVYALITPVPTISTSSPLFQLVSGTGEITDTPFFTADFEFADGWPGTLATPSASPSFLSLITESFDFSEGWPGTLSNPTASPSFATLFEDSFENADGWPGT